MAPVDHEPKAFDSCMAFEKSTTQSPSARTFSTTHHNRFDPRATCHPNLSTSSACSGFETLRAPVELPCDQELREPAFLEAAQQQLLSQLRVLH